MSAQYSSIKVYLGSSTTPTATYLPADFPAYLAINSALETAVFDRLSSDNIPSDGARIVYIPADTSENVGTASIQTTGDLTVSGNLAVGGAITGSSLSVTGDVTAFGSVSDARFKEAVSELVDGLEVIRKLQPVNFRWREDLFYSAMGGKEDVGFIAQEVREVAPLATSVAQVANTDALIMRHERLIPYLVRAIQQLDEKMSSL